jgi:small GTP-binding protein
MSNPPEGQGKKLVFIGDSGVGKTCIISRFTQGIFENNVNSTRGASYSNKIIDVNGTPLSLDIWDTAGQETYKSLTKYFYKGAKMALLVYDITRKESFDNIKSFWYDQIKEFGDEGVILGIVGNKCDMYDEEAVPEEEAREYAKSIGAIFQLTSAQNNSGINELFKNIGAKYLDPNTKIEEPEPGQNNIIINAHDHIQKDNEQKKKKSCCK